MSRIAYIAGPMRGIPLHNFPAFDRAAAKYRAMGWMVFSPADLDRQEGVTEHTPADHISMRDAMRRDLNAIIDHCDTIVLLTGWENSRGTAAELALARVLGLEIVYDED